MTISERGEGLRAARFLLVLSSVSPVFILWAIRGTCLVPPLYFTGACAVAVLLPNGFLWLRVQTARKLHEVRQIEVGEAEDHQDHLLVYLFAMLLPFYSESLTSWRELAATLTALAFIVFLFWRLNLHYMNLIFAVLGYRVFSVDAPRRADDEPGPPSLVLIAPRSRLARGTQLAALRISDTVFLELRK